MFNEGRIDVIDQLMAPNYQEHNPMPNQGPGLRGFKELISGFRTAFPDIQITVEDLISEGDRVVGRLTSKGTHKGDFMGMAATGKQFNCRPSAIMGHI